jgi:PAS domain S-box-containing protein
LWPSYPLAWPRRRLLNIGSEQIFRTQAEKPEDDSFQKFLLAFSNTAAQATSSAEILKIFCAATRAYFQVSGAYVWQRLDPGQMVGVEADGWMSDRFRSSRLSDSENAITNQAVHRKQAVYFNAIHSSADAMAAEYGAQSMLAVPLMIHNEVIGAAVFLHTTDSHFFSPDQLSKASILAAQLGSFLEAQRLSAQSREEQRRAGILAEVAHSLHSNPDSPQLVQAVADHLRTLLRSPLVCILVREATGYELRAVATQTPAAADSVRARLDRKQEDRTASNREVGLPFAADLAHRAVAAGELITAAIDPATHALGDLVPPGTVLAAPFRTSGKHGAVLVFPRVEGSFGAEEKALLPVITSFAAVAISNAELYAKASAQANELHQILSIATELGSSSDLDQFMQKFVLRASDFLGFGRAFVGLTDNERFQVRWSFADGKHGPGGFVIPEGVLTRAMRNKEVLWADDATHLPGVNQPILTEFNVHQLLAVPLLGVNGQVLGIFGVLDRLDQGSISKEDIRRAQALAAQVTVALEVSRNLLLSEQHRDRAESLTNLALQVSSLRGPEFSACFVERTATMMQARGAALVVENGGESSVVPGLLPNSAEDQALWKSFARAVMATISPESQPIVVTTAEALLGPELASRAGWEQVILARLQGSEQQIVGALCLVDRAQPLSEEDRQLLQAIAGQASVPLENARFFTRMEQANRHWIEIFDAISDFIVAHDESGNILRVNRSLAEFIGVQPQQLIGLNMGALLATGISPLTRSCPFCRSTGNSTDEYVHPVLERTYLVSTSQVHAAASSEGLQTIHVLKDITDRREAERRYRELFDNIQEGLFFCSPDGRFIEVNDALVRMLGHASRDELLHCDPREEVFPRPEHHRDLFALMERQGTLRNREEVLRHKDGGAVHVLINAFAVRDAQGKVVQYRGLMLDISGLKAYQSELQRERDFSGKILNNTQSLILVSDTAGLISYANRRWQALGYEPHAVLGQPLENLVAPAKRAALRDAFTAVLAGSQVDNLDLQILRGDGRVLQFSVNLSPMRDELAQVSSIVVVMSDITDAASLQAKLMHAEKMAAVGQLVSGVAHEVNNPLTAILGFADLLVENQELPESARKDVRVILQEAQRTKQIVQNLLSFARQMPPQRKPVQLNAILKRTIQLRAYDFHSRGVANTESYDDALPFVIGDSQQLQQVFLNILNNAYDAVRESVTGPRIEISTRGTHGFVEVAFCDNGHGITHPDRIFDPFFTTKEVGEGTGLGLSICYGIVKEHGGEILCANHAGGTGATFTVRFPSVSESASLSAIAGVTQP